MNKIIILKINNKIIKIKVNYIKRLLDFLREDMYIIGFKEGCGEGECGVCVVIINKELVNLCLVIIGFVSEKEIIIIEGLKGIK